MFFARYRLLALTSTLGVPAHATFEGLPAAPDAAIQAVVAHLATHGIVLRQAPDSQWWTVTQPRAEGYEVVVTWRTLPRTLRSMSPGVPANLRRPRAKGPMPEWADCNAAISIPVVDGSGFQPSQRPNGLTWGCAPGWDGDAPLALASGGPKGVAARPACAVRTRRTRPTSV